MADKKKKCYAHLKDKKEELEIFSLVSTASLASKIMEQILLEVFFMMSKGQKEAAVNTDLPVSQCAWPVSVPSMMK